MNRVIPFELKDEHITLIRLLKATGTAENGAMAKQLVDLRQVLVQGIPATEYRKKIFPGMVVSVPDWQVKIEVISAG